MFRLMFFLTLALCWPIFAVAQPVELTSKDGSFTVLGELLSMDGEYYRVKTASGTLTLDAGDMRCSGEGCPDPEQLIARVTVLGPVGLIHNLMPPLIELYAVREDLDFRKLFLSDDRVIWELRSQDGNQLFAVFEGQVANDALAQSEMKIGKADISLVRLEAQPPVRQDVIALDAILPLVASENPRAMVTQAQLSSLLSGRFETWSPLGGELPVQRFTLSGTEALLRRWHKSRIARNAVVLDDAVVLADAVTADPGAIGIGLYSAIGNTVPLVVGGSCGLAIPATRDTIRAEDYPLTQPIFLQRMGSRQPKIVRDFIAFARSDEAQAAIAASGYVDQSIGRIGFERQGDRIANAVLGAGDDPDAAQSVREMIAALVTRQRLTLTFRFRDGESALDAQSTSNIQRLADAINRGDFDGKTLSFVGFTDGIGPAAGNKRLSVRRAQSVRAAVAARVSTDLVSLRYDGFGEVLPMACDDTDWGRQVNRRVEVWVD